MVPKCQIQGRGNRVSALQRFQKRLRNGEVEDALRTWSCFPRRWMCGGQKWLFASSQSQLPDRMQLPDRAYRCRSMTMAPFGITSRIMEGIEKGEAGDLDRERLR